MKRIGSILTKRKKSSSRRRPPPGKFPGAPAVHCPAERWTCCLRQTSSHETSTEKAEDHCNTVNSPSCWNPPSPVTPFSIRRLTPFKAGRYAADGLKRCFSVWSQMENKHVLNDGSTVKTLSLNHILLLFSYQEPKPLARNWVKFTHFVSPGRLVQKHQLDEVRNEITASS